MRRAAALPLALLAAATAGCPGPDENPAKLWIALSSDRTGLRLVGTEPHPF